MKIEINHEKLPEKVPEKVEIKSNKNLENSEDTKPLQKAVPHTEKHSQKYGNSYNLSTKSRVWLRTTKKWEIGITFDSNFTPRRILIHRLKNGYDIVIREDNKGFELLEQIYCEEEIYLPKERIQVNIFTLNSKVINSNRPKLICLFKELQNPFLFLII